MASKHEEYGAFDLLRFLLASAVMLSHEGVLHWEQAGNLAVQVFFALSGWLIGGILLNTPVSKLGRFYYNRSTRIWIPYFFVVAALYALSFVFEPHRSVRWSEFLVYDVTFTHNWFTLPPDAMAALAQMPFKGTGNHFWSLAVEEQFYLAAPLLIALIPFGRSLVLWVCIAALLYLAKTQYASVGFGVLAAVSAARYPNWQLRTPMRVVLLLLAIGATSAMWMTTQGMWHITPDLYWYFAPPFAIAVVLLLTIPISRHALIRWLGGVSFPFYLGAWLGTFPLHALQKHLHLDFGQYSWAVEFLAGLAATGILYQLIDVSIQRYRDRFYTPALGWVLCVTAYALVACGVAFWLAYGPKG